MLKTMSVTGDQSNSIKFSDFSRSFFESTEEFSCIGEGSIGGKTSGLAFIRNIIKENLSGVYNVSIGQKVYLNDLINWLNISNKKKLKKVKIKKKSDSFYLNNRKLMSKIKISNSLTDLKKYCYRLSKDKFP